MLTRTIALACALSALWSTQCAAQLVQIPLLPCSALHEEAASEAGAKLRGDAQAFADKILAARGQHRDFDFAPGSKQVDLAFAALCASDGGSPTGLIVFNVAYMTRLAKTPHAVDFVWAHEIGHIVNSHHVTSNAANPRERECYADRFAGRILAELGTYDLEAVKAVLTVIAPEREPGYPSREQRIACVAEGWTGGASVEAVVAVASSLVAFEPPPPMPTSAVPAAPHPARQGILSAGAKALSGTKAAVKRAANSLIAPAPRPLPPTGVRPPPAGSAVRKSEPSALRWDKEVFQDNHKGN